MARRSSDEQAEHDRVVRLLARQRFPQETCRVVINPGDQRNRGLTYTTRSCRRRTVYPDIVALLAPGTELCAVGEVETASTVTPAAVTHWRLLAQHAPRLYLFVPLASAEAAKGLVEGIANVQLRTYRLHGDCIIVGET